jgi:hypothetical protein
MPLRSFRVRLPRCLRCFVAALGSRAFRPSACSSSGCSRGSGARRHRDARGRGAGGKWHHLRTHRSCSRARWSCDRVGLVALRLHASRLVGTGEPLCLAVRRHAGQARRAEGLRTSPQLRRLLAVEARPLGKHLGGRRAGGRAAVLAAGRLLAGHLSPRAPRPRPDPGRAGPRALIATAGTAPERARRRVPMRARPWPRPSCPTTSSWVVGARRDTRLYGPPPAAAKGRYRSARG